MKISKVLIVAIAVIFYSYACDAQDNKNKNKLRFGPAFSAMAYLDVLQFLTEDGDPEYSGIFYYSSGLNFQYSLSESLTLNTSIVYGSYKIRIVPWNPVEDKTFTNNIHLLYVPITVQKKFYKHFFMISGMLIDFELNKNNIFHRQNGIGGTFGMGVEFYPDSKISFFINPYINIHSLVHFGTEILNDRLLETGFKLGLLF